MRCGILVRFIQPLCDVCFLVVVVIMSLTIGSIVGDIVPNQIWRLALPVGVISPSASLYVMKIVLYYVPLWNRATATDPTWHDHARWTPYAICAGQFVNIAWLFVLLVMIGNSRENRPLSGVVSEMIVLVAFWFVTLLLSETVRRVHRGYSTLRVGRGGKTSNVAETENDDDSYQERLARLQDASITESQINGKRSGKHKVSSALMQSESMVDQEPLIERAPNDEETDSQSDDDKSEELHGTLGRNGKSRAKRRGGGGFLRLGRNRSAKDE